MFEYCSSREGIIKKSYNFLINVTVPNSRPKTTDIEHLIVFALQRFQ